jgi:energy-coupling factor transporter ATP-binding protein EcfA2
LAGEIAVKIENLSFTYSGGEKPALNKINLEIKRGEYLGIMGLNGAGKTTLGLSINGIVPQSTMGLYDGKVTVEGLDTATTPVREMARTVGIVFDNPEFQMSQVSAAEEVALGLENLGVPNEEMPPRVGAALGTVGLAGFEERSPMGLSGGQQQRLAIASVLAMQPKILFMDEPTSNLDPIGKEEVFEKAKPFLEAMGKKLYYCGGPGTGLHAKLTQNLVLSNILQAFNEGIVLSTKAGVPPALMLDILSNSAAKSGLIEYKAPFIFRRDFTTNFSVKWMHKDIGLMLESAAELNVPTPLTALTRQMFQYGSRPFQ